MLDINMEFRKGILFVRLNGDLISNNCRLLNKKIDNLILENSVRFISFNVEGLNNLDVEGINTILKYNMALSKIKGMVLICGVNNELVKLRVHDSLISKTIYEANNELEIMNYINLGGYL